ncbi:MAG: YlxR family protein [Chloroflexota bacterium]|nr:YlxR family protein [Chloroflexota bacterium]
MVAERSCVACRSKRHKSELVRVVRQPDGQVVVDERLRLPGRGAYLCRDPRCWQAGVKRRQVDRTLRATLSGAARSSLLEQLAARGGYISGVKH